MNNVNVLSEAHAKGSDLVTTDDVNKWFHEFNQWLITKASGSSCKLSQTGLFLQDAHWRDIVAFGRVIDTCSGLEEMNQKWSETQPHKKAANFHIDTKREPIRWVKRAGRDVLEVIAAFEWDGGSGEAVLRFMLENGHLRAWTIMTALAKLDDITPNTEPDQQRNDPYARDFTGPNWLDERKKSAAYEQHEPTVLIVGGGHAGLTAAAQLGNLGIDCLVVDRMERIGDNWRKRYHTLSLHNQKDSNHLPFLPFPKTWPLYIPKDKIANWLEFYVEAMEINFWTHTDFLGAKRLDHDQKWEVQLRTKDGNIRHMYPRHVIMATSVSNKPKIPSLPGLDSFEGDVLHSSQFHNAERYRDKSVLVMGTGTSSHDISQELHGHGAHVTMIQRSPTLITNVEPSAQLYDSLLLTPGPSLEDRDILAIATPLEPMIEMHKLITAESKKLDKELLEGLEKVGFRLYFGPDDTGWPLLYRNRGGGYYFNIGCSELLINGEIKLMASQDIEAFTPKGLKMTNGDEKTAELLVLATGYEGPESMVLDLFGPDVAKKVGKIWGFGNRQELSNMWTRTAQEGLWFTAGAFSQCRQFSKYLALQIAQDELARS